MVFSKKLKVVALSTFLTASTFSNTITIDFDELVPRDDFSSNPLSHVAIRAPLYERHGYQLTTIGFFQSIHPGDFRSVSGNSLLVGLPGNTTTLSRIDGGAFDLFSIDLIKLVERSTALNSVTFIGMRPDGSTFSTGTLIDNLAGPFMLETKSFPNMRAIKSVSWTTNSPFHHFDNIVLSATHGVSDSGIPSVITAGIILGLIGLANFRKKRGLQQFARK